jgi:putative flippase GtrA
MAQGKSVTSLLWPLSPERRIVALQMGRYAFAGLTITLALAASYWALAELAGIDPMVSLTIAFLVFSAISYVTHGSYSFKGHGERDQQHVRAIRFVMVTLAGFCLNQFFVWLLVKHLGGPTWWPTVPIIFITPMVSFVLLRRFVYG